MNYFISIQYLCIILQFRHQLLYSIWCPSRGSINPPLLQTPAQLCRHPFVGKRGWKRELKFFYLFNITKNIISEYKQERQQL